MFLKINFQYNPFTDTSLAFFLKDGVRENDKIGQLLNEIDLYYQPVQEPYTASTFLGIKICLVAIAEYLHVKVFYLMEKENGIVKDVTQLLACVHVIFWPFLMLFIGSTDFIYPMDELLGDWYCHLGSFLFYFLGHIIIGHSFVSALMRYFFMLHHNEINKYGKERVKRFFFFMQILLPLISAVWEMLDGSDLDAMSFLNKCHGKYDRAFLIDTTSLSVAKRGFCVYEIYDTTGIWSQIVAILSRFFCAANTIVQVIIGFNLTEGILYFKLLRHMHR